MPTLSFDDVTVEFPHEPYECQLEYMKRLLHSLKQGEHAILESPTGTGKTLCLLCTSLAWLATDAVNKVPSTPLCTETTTLLEIKSKPRVIFASRTHSQLAQAVEVLKRTAYSDRNISVIGSRDQLCLLPEVASLESNSAKIFGCRARVQTRTCEYYRNFESKRDNLLNTMKANGVVDIEDLIKFGHSTRCCPYYMSRELKTTADIIFMPYNYLLDPKIRRLHNIELENAVVIFDEAHNIEQVCEDAASVTLSSSLLAAAIEYLRAVCEVVFSLAAETDANGQTDLNEFVPGRSLSSFDISRAGEDKLSSLNLEKLLSLKGQLIELERLIDALDVAESGVTKPSEFLFDLLARAGFTAQTTELALHTVEEILSVSTAAENPQLRRPRGINEVSEFLKTVFESRHPPAQSKLLSLFRPQNVDYSRCYRLFVKDELLNGRGSALPIDGNSVWGSHAGNTTRSTTNRTLSYWCLSPGRAMQDLIREQVRCVILTSGTLYPIEPIQAELRMHFPITLQNPHVITQEQVRLAVITRGKDGEALNSSYASREKPGYRKALGHTLLDLMKVVPNGLLVFFPSYMMMTQCIDAWKNTGLEDQMSQCKRLFVEPRDKMQFSKVFTDYRNVACGSTTSNTHGAALFAVMRGRASEGLDLADYAGRGVAVLGLPYPPYHDPRVRLKMAYLDEQLTQLRNQASATADVGSYKSSPSLEKAFACFPTGRKWYNQQAWRAVNQSIGRVIRHNRDFGAVFLCDERFAPMNARAELPRWMQPSLRVYSEHNDLITATAAFFKDAAILHPPLKQYVQDSQNLPMDGPRDLSGKRSRPTKPCVLSNIPRANEAQAFTPSMALKVPTFDTDLLLAKYVTLNSTTSPDTMEDQLTDTSVFARIEMATDSNHRTDSLVDETDATDDKDLETKLVRAKSTKRLKIDYYAQISDSGAQSFTDPAVYLCAVKSYFLRRNQDRDSLHKFKEALKEYQSSEPKLNISLPEDPQDGCVRKLHTKLSYLFEGSDTTHLLQGASCFLVPAHRPIFLALCTERENYVASKTTVAKPQSDPSPGVTGSSPERRLTCCKCHIYPSQTPLVSTCKHVACFTCWRTVIEEGNHRCPSCRTLVRRRMLRRLVPTTSTQDSNKKD